VGDLSDLLSSVGSGTLPGLLANASSVVGNLQPMLPPLLTSINSVKGSLSQVKASMGGSVDFSDSLAVAVTLSTTVLAARDAIARALPVSGGLPSLPTLLSGAKAAWGAASSGSVTSQFSTLQAVVGGISASAFNITQGAQTLPPADWRAFVVAWLLPGLVSLNTNMSSLQASVSAPVASAVLSASMLPDYATRVLSIACGDEMGESVRSATVALDALVAVAAANVRLLQLRDGLAAMSPVMGTLPTAMSNVNASLQDMQPLLIAFNATWGELAARGVEDLQATAVSLKDTVLRIVDSFDDKVMGAMTQASQAVARWGAVWSLAPRAWRHCQCAALRRRGDIRFLHVPHAAVRCCLACDPTSTRSLEQLCLHPPGLRAAVCRRDHGVPGRPAVHCVLCVPGVRSGGRPLAGNCGHGGAGA
jgi:hypothetical protein